MAHTTFPDPEETPTLDIATAGQFLGLGRTASYVALREGRWPTPVIRLGSRIRVPTYALLRILEVPGASTDEGAPAA